MTTLTLDQQTALDFYSEMVDKVQYFGLTILADREERLLFRQGKKLIEQALTKIARSCNYPLISVETGTKYLKHFYQTLGRPQYPKYFL